MHFCQRCRILKMLLAISFARLPGLGLTRQTLVVTSQVIFHGPEQVVA